METIESAKYGGYAATNSKDAVRILYENKYHTCIIYDNNPSNLDAIVKASLEKIKKRNAKIPNINDQMLPSVYRWQAKDEDDITRYYAAEISMGRFEDNAQLLYMFSEPVYSVLTDSTARKPLSTKALTTLAMMGYMMTKEK